MNELASADFAFDERTKRWRCVLPLAAGGKLLLYLRGTPDDAYVEAASLIIWKIDEVKTSVLSDANATFAGEVAGAFEDSSLSLSISNLHIWSVDISKDVGEAFTSSMSAYVTSQAFDPTVVNLSCPKLLISAAIEPLSDRFAILDVERLSDYED